jgi:hypothetical protein
MTKQIQYEVLSKQNGRWEINSQYPKSKEDVAIKEAKSLQELKHVEDVKVVREVFDPKEGISREYIVYQPSKKKYRPPRKFPKESLENKKTTQMKKVYSETKRKGHSLHYTLMNIIVVCSFSIFIIASFTWFASGHIIKIFESIFK